MPLSLPSKFLCGCEMLSSAFFRQQNTIHCPYEDIDAMQKQLHWSPHLVPMCTDDTDCALIILQWDAMQTLLCLRAGRPWTSILVRTGIFRRPAGENDPDHPADLVVQDVLKAVEAALHRTRQGRWHQMR